MWMKILVNNQGKKTVKKLNTRWLLKFSKSNFIVPLRIVEYKTVNKHLCISGILNYLGLKIKFTKAEEVFFFFYHFKVK